MGQEKLGSDTVRRLRSDVRRRQRGSRTVSANRPVRTCSKARTSGATDARWPLAMETWHVPSGPTAIIASDRLLSGHVGRGHDEPFLVHAEPGAMLPPWVEQENRNHRLRVPGRRRGVPARFRVDLSTAARNVSTAAWTAAVSRSSPAGPRRSSAEAQSSAGGMAIGASTNTRRPDKPRWSNSLAAADSSPLAGTTTPRSRGDLCIASSCAGDTFRATRSRRSFPSARGGRRRRNGGTGRPGDGDAVRGPDAVRPRPPRASDARGRSSPFSSTSARCRGRRCSRRIAADA